MRSTIVVLIMLCSGCASYVTPGGSIHLDDIKRPDIAAVAAVKPSPHFPANIVLARIQAPAYRSYSSDSYGAGRYSVVTTEELLTDEQWQEMTRWPSVEGVAPINRLLLPARLDSLDDLRLSAVKLQADVLLVYTTETSFRIQGRDYGPVALISLGLVPDRDAYITCTASALFTDVRTGFIYGASEATAKTSGLTNVWSSSSTIDKKRLEAERQAFTMLLSEAGKTWSGIAKRYQ